MDAKNWRWIVGRGVVSVLFGLLALFLPLATFFGLMALFAAFALIDGVASSIAAMSRRAPGEKPWWMLLLGGVAGVAVAVLWVVSPVRTSIAFLYVLGAWGVATGILEIAAAVRLRRIIRGEWLLALAGALSVAFGVMVWFWPLAGALALVWWIGAYALVFGGLLIALGLRLRTLAGDLGVHEVEAPGGLRQGA